MGMISGNSDSQCHTLGRMLTHGVGKVASTITGKTLGVLLALQHSTTVLAEDVVRIERNNYQALGEPVGPYSHSVRHGNTLYVSGLTAFGTPAQNGDITEQTEAIFHQLDTVLKAEGVGLGQLLSVTLYLRDIDELAQLRDTLFRLYSKDIPASAVVEVNSLFAPSLKIEITAIAGVR